jgi:hypothetical protein
MSSAGPTNATASRNMVDALSDRLRDLKPTDPERRARLVCTRLIVLHMPDLTGWIRP